MGNSLDRCNTSRLFINSEKRLDLPWTHSRLSSKLPVWGLIPEVFIYLALITHIFYLVFLVLANAFLLGV